MSDRARFALVFGLVLVALALCVAVSVQRVQQHLMVRAQAALAQAGIPLYGLQVEGRDIVLEGFVRSEQEATRAVAVLGAVAGVRRVSNRTTLERVVETPVGAARGPAPTSTPGIPPHLRMQRLGRRLFVSGVVSDESVARRIAEAARQRFGASYVILALRVRTGVAGAPWLASTDLLVEMLARATDNARLSIQGTTAVLSAQLERPRDADRIRNLSRSVPGLQWRLDLLLPGESTRAGGAA